jgi:hypothetical protein
MSRTPVPRSTHNAMLDALARTAASAVEARNALLATARALGINLEVAPLDDDVWSRANMSRVRLAAERLRSRELAQ